MLQSILLLIDVLSSAASGPALVALSVAALLVAVVTLAMVTTVLTIAMVLLLERRLGREAARPA